MKYLSIILFVSISIDASSQIGLHISQLGDVGVNTDQMFSNATFTIVPQSSTGSGGMYIHTINFATDPYYGYAANGTEMSRSYFDLSKASLIFSIDSEDKMSIHNSGQVGIGTTSPHASALLDLTSSNQGLLLPRMTTSQRNDIAKINGLTVYDTSIDNIYYVANNEWKSPLTSHLWQIDDQGIHRLSNVGVGQLSDANIQMSILSQSSNIALDVTQDFNDTNFETVYGIRSTATGQGLSKYGIIGETLSTDDETNSFLVGVQGTVLTGNNATFAAGIYGDINGNNDGIQDYWAGYFGNRTKIKEELHIDNTFLLQSDNDNALLQMNNSNDQLTIQLRAKESSSEGSDLIMYNNEGNKTVEIDADVSGNGYGILELYSTTGVKTVKLNASELTDQGAELVMYNSSGVETINIDADYSEIGRIETGELSITGGSDLAELFSTDEIDISPGDLVVIDEQYPNKIKKSNQYADRRVIGVVSGAQGINPGMIMGQKNSIAYGNIPVAISGRVYVKVESTSQVKPGDFLTTSRISGLATKVTNWEGCRGAIVGKALSSINNEGYVLVLIHLQ